MVSLVLRKTFSKILVLVLAARTVSSEAATLTVDASKPLRSLDRHRLLGSNVAGWYFKSKYDNPEVQRAIRDLGPILLRLPGGSWGDGTFWNGNGVRHGQTVDYSKLRSQAYSPWSAPWGTWDIDYSGYAPGFLVDVGPANQPKMSSTEWHGHVDVKVMHDFIRDLGDEPFVIVNAGTGSPRDAAEWVRWANLKMGYRVRYWEVGNELEGSWEGGHFLPNGKELNGEIFARRYEEFALAMKAVDPTIKVGCMDWLEAVLRHRGDLVDFLSIHSYPVLGSESDIEVFAKIGPVRENIESAQALIRKYQPKREKEIEINFSEWNMGGRPDIIGAQWPAAWVGEMFRWGADFAMQWTVFDMVAYDDSPTRMSIYWAFWLWSHAMGDTLLSSETQGPLISYTTRSKEGLSIMVLNTSSEQEARLDVELKNFAPASEGREVRWTRGEYLWVDRVPDLPLWKKGPQTVWNTRPRVGRFSPSRAFSASVPPASIVVYMIPEEGRKPSLELTIPPRAGKLKLHIHAPEEAYAGDNVEILVYAQNGEEAAPFPGPLQDGRIEVQGAAADRETVRLAEAAGRFLLKADKAGTAKVRVGAGGAEAVQRVVFKPSIPRPRVFWDFEEASPPQGMRSQWKLTLDGSIRPNQRVARVDIGGDRPQGDKKRELLVINPLPEGGRLDKKNIRGAFFDIRTLKDFSCGDPEAFVEVVLQSPMNWWMPLGRTRLSECGDWKTMTFLTDDPKQIRAMPEAFNLWFILSAKEPVHGSICLDRAGLMIR